MTVWNLTFHGVGAPPRRLAPDEAAVWLTVEQLHAALDAIDGRDDVRLTFDDGNASDVEHALPALLERGRRAAFFPLVGRLGSPGSLSAADVRTLADAGMTIGSHGIHHRDWRRVGDDELAEELRGSRLALERLTGRPVTAASCPFGSYDRRVLAGLRRQAGYGLVFTSDGGPADPRAWLQPRTTLRADGGGRPPAASGAAGTAVRRVKRLVKRWR